jgi:hypothetical protein
LSGLRPPSPSRLRRRGDSAAWQPRTDRAYPHPAPRSGRTFPPAKPETLPASCPGCPGRPWQDAIRHLARSSWQGEPWGNSASSATAGQRPPAPGSISSGPSFQVGSADRLIGTGSGKRQGRDTVTPRPPAGGHAGGAGPLRAGPVPGPQGGGRGERWSRVATVGMVLVVIPPGCGQVSRATPLRAT